MFDFYYQRCASEWPILGELRSAFGSVGLCFSYFYSKQRKISSSAAEWESQTLPHTKEDGSSAPSDTTMEVAIGPPFQWAEPHSITMCKKDTLLETMTSWNE